MIRRVMVGERADDRSPLHYAALENDREAAQAWLETGADADVRDALGFTPLHFAAQEWSVDVATLLLERGATVDVANDHGNTPLFVAVFHSKGRGDLIELLRSHGQTRIGRTTPARRHSALPN